LVVNILQSWESWIGTVPKAMGFFIVYREMSQNGFWNSVVTSGGFFTETANTHRLITQVVAVHRKNGSTQARIASSWIRNSPEE
jgi:predicted oxidoreductase